MLGIDISNWQAGFDLSRTQGIDVTIFKATGGNSYVDKTCAGFVEQAKKNNKLWGFYHFAKDGCNSQSGKAEADFFYAHCKNYFGHGIPVLDLEDNGLNDWATYTKAFIDRIHELTGIYPIIYTGLDGIRRCSTIPSILENCPIWFAGYPLGYIGYWLHEKDNPRNYYSIDERAKIVMWQFTSAIKMQGYNVDSNLVYMTKQEWLDYAKGVKTVDNIGFEVWSYRNKALEKVDAYQILRDVRDAVKSIDKRLAVVEKKVGVK